jgi:hypothetical protein
MMHRIKWALVGAIVSAGLMATWVSAQGWSFFSDPRQSALFHLSPGWTHVIPLELRDGKVLVVLYNTTTGELTSLRFEMPPCVEDVARCAADPMQCCP